MAEITNMTQLWKYIVWIGGVDNYYENYEDAKQEFDKWISRGYDDVIIEEIKHG